MGHRRTLAGLVTLGAMSALLFVSTSDQIAGASTSSSHSRTGSQASCIRETKSDPTRPMPEPKRLGESLVGRSDGPLTMAPVALGQVTRVVNPLSLWSQYPKTKGGDLSVFLAYVSYPYPAALQPDGTVKPELDHLLSWLVLSLDTPGFDSAGGPLGSSPHAATSKCTFGTPTAGSLEIWNATTGMEVENTGFTLLSPRSLHRVLKPLPRRALPALVSIPRSEYVSNTTGIPDGIVMTPPTNAWEMPEITRQTALKDALQQGFLYAGDKADKPTAFYGIMTNTGMKSVPLPAGESIAAGTLSPERLAQEFAAGEATLVYQDVPTWVVRFQAPATEATGGPPRPGETTTTLPANYVLPKQTIDIFMNADTGKYMFG